jgi:hypothetical protein
VPSVIILTYEKASEKKQHVVVYGTSFCCLPFMIEQQQHFIQQSASGKEGGRERESCQGRTEGED